MGRRGLGDEPLGGWGRIGRSTGGGVMGLGGSAKRAWSGLGRGLRGGGERSGGDKRAQTQGCGKWLGFSRHSLGLCWECAQVFIRPD